MKNKFFIIGIIIIALFLAIFIFIKNQTLTNIQNTEVSKPENRMTSLVVPIHNQTLIKPHSPSKGSKNAKITLVEFLDPECESCSAMYPIVKKIYEDYKSDLQIIVRYMTYHKNSKYVANILEGARAENKYWETLDLLFETQNQWGNHHNPNPDLIPEILKPLNLNLKKILADAQSGKYDKQIEEDVTDGKNIGVSGTPTFYVNGIVVDELGYEPLKLAIDAALSKNK